MRLEPVFLVEPRPTPQAVPTRRAFLLAGGAFAFGSVIGGACGYSIGAAKGDAVEAAGEKDGEEKSRDPQLEEMRRLATTASIEELVALRLQFLGTMSDHYRTDEVLWEGVRRLANAVLNGSCPDKRVTSRLLVQAIDKACPPRLAPSFESTVKLLQQVK